VPANKNFMSPRRKFAAPSRRFEHVHIDIIMSVSDGKRYYLICINRFSRWSEIFLLENQEAETVAKARLWRFIRFGVPLQSNHSFKQLNELTDMTEEHRILSADQRMVKRFYRQLKAAIVGQKCFRPSCWKYARLRKRTCKQQRPNLYMKRH